MSTIVYNMDCMEGMKQYPDNYFDLAIVDPPYGAGFTESGGCTGWFTKYREDHQERGWEYQGQTSTARKSTSIHRQGANTKRDGKWVKPEWNKDKKIISWDVPPKQEYFEELFRISRNQVIWGGELFPFTTYKMFPDMAENKCA